MVFDFAKSHFDIRSVRSAHFFSSRTEVFKLFAGSKALFRLFRLMLRQNVPLEISTTFQALSTEVAFKWFLFRMGSLVVPQSAVIYKSLGTLIAFVPPNILVAFFVFRECTGKRKRFIANSTRITPFIFLMQSVAFSMKIMEALFMFYDRACSAKHFAAVRAFARLLSCVDSLVVSPCVRGRESAVAVLTEEGFLTGVK